MVFCSRGVAILFLFVLSYNCQILWARRLPPSLQWFLYSSRVDDLGPYLKDNVPRGHRNVLLFAEHITIHSDINLNSNYYDYLVPYELTIVCDTLEVLPKGPGSYAFNLAGPDAPNLVSYNDKKNSAPWVGKDGGNGGSIYIYAKYKAGSGRVDIDVRGGHGGKGQDGYNGLDGDDGADWPYLTNGEDGEDGGNGGAGGKGGDAGEIVITSMQADSITNLYSLTSGGEGGEGGEGGKPGNGGSIGGCFFWCASPGNRGQPGHKGQSGGDGSHSELQLIQTSEEIIFYRSLPITGTNLQKALNIEMHKMRHAKHQNDNNKLQDVRNSINSIQTIAVHNGYDIIQQRCSDMLDLSSQNLQLSPALIEVQTSKIKKHFNELCQVACESVDIEQSEFHHRVQTSRRLKANPHYARAFNHLGNHHSRLKERYEASKKLAYTLSDYPTERLKDDTKEFLERKFYQHAVDKLMSSAKQKPYTAAALSAEEEAGTGSALVTEGKVSIDASEILEGLTVVEETGVVAEAVVAPEVVAVQVVGMFAFRQLETYFNSEFESHTAEVAKYEAAMHNRARMDRKNAVRKQADKAKKNQPKKRQEYGKNKNKNREPIPTTRGSDEDPPSPIELSGKYIGVLDKCEPVEGNFFINDLVEATFDAIYIVFTETETGETINLNDQIDITQQEELNVQLELYRLPLSGVPSFIITTMKTSTAELIHEEAVGHWFEFDVTYTLLGHDRVLITSSVLNEIQTILRRMISLDTDHRIPATVSNIVRLSPEMEETIVHQLGLEFPNQNPAAEIAPQLPGPVTINRAEVANVGQGSCNLLYSGNEIKVVYDLGYGKGRPGLDVEETLIHDISESPTIIISHWDLDHYRYLLKYSARILATPKTFIAPLFGTNLGVTVKRAVESIPPQNRNLFPPNAEQLIQVPGLINLNIRTTTAINGNDKNNVGAITICINDNLGKPLFLMPGDASFDRVPVQQKQYALYTPIGQIPLPSLCHLVATHHASTNNIGNIPLRAIEGNSKVHFSYGLFNRYGHSAYTAWPRYAAAGWSEYDQTVGNNRINIELDQHLTRTACTCTI